MKVLHNRWPRLLWWTTLLLAFATGVIAAVLRVDRSVAIASSLVIGVIWALTDSANRKSMPPLDSGEWQRKIDAEYSLAIDGNEISLYQHGNLTFQFLWDKVVEIQHLSAQTRFPPLFWRVITENGEYLLPDGGRYIREFKNNFIYRLPDYRSQRVVSINAPPGFTRATSMWRREDRYPKWTSEELERMDEWSW